MGKKYDDEQYAESGDRFTCYDRLLVELNNQMYYDESTYKKFLNENGLTWNDDYDKNTDHVHLLETVYTILQTLYNNISIYRKIETEFVTESAAATSLQTRLKVLRAEIERVKDDMHYEDSDFTFMYYTR